MRRFAQTGVAHGLAVLVAALLSACVATTPAPVAERPFGGKVPPAAVSKPEPVAIKPEAPAPKPPETAVVVTPLTPALGPTYTVKQGDTLFSIARANNVPMRDLAAWNNIEVPYAITIGQQLRLTPPDGVPLAPVKPGPAAGAAESTAPAGDGNLKSQPLGQRVPYSEQAYAQMTKASPPPKPDVKSEPKPEVAADNKVQRAAETKPEVKPETKSESKPDKPRADGELNWGWPTQGKVVRTFSEGSNKGIAIAGKRGQPVQASAAGRVIFSGSGIRGLGNLVVIRHNSNYLSVYAHNDKLLVKQGQNVTKGQHIADMGNSDADQVKLHFEIRRQGKPVDPMRLLPEG